MNRNYFLISAGLVLLAPLCATGADLSDGVSRIARDARKDMRDLRVQELRVTPPAPVIKFTVGVAADKDEADSRTYSTPFDLNYKTTGDDWWKFQVKGDGYTKVTSPQAATVDGLSDLKLNLAHLLTKSFVGIGGITLPSHSDVGSTNVTEHVTLVHSRDIIGRWSMVAFADIKRYEGASVGTSSYRQSAYAEVDYAIDGDRTILLNILRTHRKGAQSSTDVGIEYDFPILKSITGAFSIARGLSPGARHTGIEFDLTVKF